MKNHHYLLYSCILLNLFYVSCKNITEEYTILKIPKWEKTTLTFDGITTSEAATENPFLDYRLNVTFTHPEKSITIPGFYAADGKAAETSADSGKVWKVHFRPDKEGTWNYKISFRKGKDIAISDDTTAGTPENLDGQTGIIEVTSNSNSEGRLEYVEKRYLQYTESGRYFIKGGAGSPENVLGYKDIDGTVRGKSPEEKKGEATANKELHHFEKHLKDWKTGDPTWQGEKGKSLIGGLNYLASKGLNSLYFITMNIDGDGKDVYPYTSYDERFRFDCSKLDQWEIIFDHMDRLGIMMHVILQETENELLLDEGDTKYERKLYLREMIARFAHHPRLMWNIGEENGPVHWFPKGQSTLQQKAMIEYLKNHDPYKNLVVVHSHADTQTRDKLFDKLLGYPALEGMSMQVDRKIAIHEAVKKWIKDSAKAKQQWVVSMDENGPWWRGVDPDDRLDNNQDTVRAEALWGTLMAGGAGTEWYFGAKNHSNDLNCEDWRTRDRMWTYTNHALLFFQRHIPFYEMESHDELIRGDQGYCFAKKERTYVVYLLYGGTGTIDLTDAVGSYSVQWYNPRTGGELQDGSIKKLKGGATVSFGNPPTDQDKDWAVLIKKNN